MEISVDYGDLLEVLPKACEKAMLAAESQITQDCNFYVMADSWNLRNSSMAKAGDLSLEVSWNTPYARRRYYESCNVSLQPNVNARTHWAEAAAENFADQWAMIIAKGASM